MKYIINESRLGDVILNFMDENITPDTGFSDAEIFENKNWIVFKVNDEELYTFFKKGLRYKFANVVHGTLKIEEMSLINTLDGYFNREWPVVFKKWLESNVPNITVNRIIGPDYDTIVDFEI